MIERRPPRIMDRAEPTPEAPLPVQTSVVRRPRAIDVASVRLEDDAFANDPIATAPTIAPSRRKGFPWLALAGSALLGLIGLGIGLWIEGLISELFALSPLAGALGLVLVAILFGGLLLAAIGEFRSLRRLGTWQEIRELAAKAVHERDERAARTVEADLLKLFADRPDLASARARLADGADDVLDAAERIAHADRVLLRPIDERAQQLVLASAKRVSVVTAVAPRALIDVAFVVLESSRLIRSVAEAYGMRPGRVGFLRLCRNVVGHLAVTGAIAVGDSIVGEALGHGVASRVSRRFGEGVLNGLMTVRIGISAMDLCRPLPFPEGRRPSVSQLAGQVARGITRQNETE